MKHEIEIPDLPEGWKAIAYRIPVDGESYLYCGKIYSYNCQASEYLIVEKIQPHRIVLELTPDELSLIKKIPIEQRLLHAPGMLDLIEKINHLEVKESAVPLTKDDSELKIGDIFYVLPKTN